LAKHRALAAAPVDVTVTLGAIEGNDITATNFGANVSFSDQFIDTTTGGGNLSIVEGALHLPVLRFPGGAETENKFDISHPDASPWIGTSNPGHKFLPQSTFLAYCWNSGNPIASPDIVLPTFSLLTAGNRGARNFDMSKAAALTQYVKDTLEAAHGTVTTFEIGNEFAAAMNAAEYGRVAGQMAQIIYAAIQAYNADPTNATEQSATKIAVQTWIQRDLSPTYPTLTDARNSLIASNNAEISALAGVKDANGVSAIKLISAVVGHYYYRPELTPGTFAGDYESGIQDSFAFARQLMNAWNTARTTNGFAANLEYQMSEWNLNHNDSYNLANYTGMRQIAPFLEMFADATAVGISSMTAWAMQGADQTTSQNFNPMALSGFAGNHLNVIGQFFGQAMVPKFLGSTPMRELHTSDNNAGLDVQAFSNGSKALVYVASTQNTAQHVNLWLTSNQMTNAALKTVDMTHYSVDASLYASQLAAASAFDANLVIRSSLDNSLATGELPYGAVNMNAYEVLLYEIQLAKTGTANGDSISGSIFADTFDGAAGADTLFGYLGNDTLKGGTGADSLTGGAGVDTFLFTALNQSSGTSYDKINDFVHGTDKIDVSAIDANSALAGNQAFVLRGDVAFSGTKGELVFDEATHLLLGDVNGDKAADITIWLPNLSQFYASNSGDLIL
jgi:Ca2+-binding RTX toxin-like protein